jgi:glycosyltransferase involved in cell wall biosynthesis
VKNPAEGEPSPARIAVAIPCFNEAAAIATVLAQFQEALPTAELFVFDNNSTDGTGDIASALGAHVIAVPQQGKGHTVRAAFAALHGFDVLVLTDGDGTYPADAAPLLIGPVLENAADMAVGARRPTPGAGAMTFTRRLGNTLIRTAFRLLIGRGNRDLLSGYRAFNHRFRSNVVLRTSGFEIESELACEAVTRRLRVVEIEVPYHPRIAGTQSKLRAFRDGWRILLTILIRSLRLRPYRPVLGWLLPCVVLALSVNRIFWGVAGLGISILWCLWLKDLTVRYGTQRDQNTR